MNFTSKQSIGKIVLTGLAVALVSLIVTTQLMAEPWANADPSGPWTPTPAQVSNAAEQGGPWTPTPNWNNDQQTQGGPWTPTPSWNNDQQTQGGPWTPTPSWNNTGSGQGGVWSNSDPSGVWVDGKPPPPPPNNPAPESGSDIVQDPNASRTMIQVLNDVSLHSVKTLGVNLGAPNNYGGANYLKNLVPNPGLEAGEFAMVFHVDQNPSSSRVQMDSWFTYWNNDAQDIGQPAGFWNGAAYEIVTGPAKGRAGRIENFTLENQRYTFYLGGGGAQPNPGDIIYVRQQMDGYFREKDMPYAFPDTNVRPGSPGKQSLRLKPNPYWHPSFEVPFDSFARDADASAGKMLLVEGNWHLEFWAKPDLEGEILEIKFERVREFAFLDTMRPLRSGWQKVEFDFFVAPGTDALNTTLHPLMLELRIASGVGDVLIDDVQLYRVDNSNHTAFSNKFIQRLREYRPGVLRNWGNQLGSSLDNQLAPEFARKTNGFSPRSRTPISYHYSLHEFLELCQALGTEPWYVIPPTFTNGELQNLVAYLSAPAGSHPYANKRAQMGQAAPWTSVFSTIHLEYGNEMWGPNDGSDPFHGATLRGSQRLGQVTSERFSVMRSSPYFNTNKFNLIMGGQAGFPMRQQEIEAVSQHHDTIGLAPYLTRELRNYGSDADRYYPSFAYPRESVTSGRMIQTKRHVDGFGKGTELAIYEMGFHTTEWYTPIDIRNDYVTGLNGGLAVPLSMLTYQRDIGVRTQAAFTAVQFSFSLPKRRWERVRMWGMLRDIEGTGRKRPIWLGIELVNRAIRGNMITTQQSGKNPTWFQLPMNELKTPITVPYVQSFAYNQGNTYGLVVFNLNLFAPEPVTLQLPGVPQGPATVSTLRGNRINDDNEDANNVWIETQQQNIGQFVNLDLPKHSITVVEWQQ